MQLENKNYSISLENNLLIKKDLSSFYKSIYLVIPLFIFCSFLVAYRVAGDYLAIYNYVFWSLFLSLSFFITFTIFFITNKAIKRYKSIVTTIRLDNKDIFITTYNEQEVLLSSKGFKVENINFNWQNKNYKALKINNNTSNKSYFIIESLFEEDFIEIINNFSNESDAMSSKSSS